MAGDVGRRGIRGESTAGRDRLCTAATVVALWYRMLHGWRRVAQGWNLKGHRSDVFAVGALMEAKHLVCDMVDGPYPGFTQPENGVAGLLSPSLP